MPPSRSVRPDDVMSVQEHETTHVPFTHPSASESLPPDVVELLQRDVDNVLVTATLSLDE